MITVLFGQHWVKSALPLQILAFNGFFALYTIGDALFVSQRKLLWQLGSQTTFAISVGIAALLGAKWGIVGIGIGVLVSTAACFIYVALMSLRIVGASFSEFARSLLPAVVVAVVLLVTGVVFKQLLINIRAPDWLVILAMMLIALIVVGALIFSRLKIFSQHKQLLIEQLQKRSSLFRK